MGLKEIATQAMTIQVKAPVQGQVTVISMPSMTAKIGGQGVYRGPLQFMVSNIMNPPCGTAAPGMLPMGVINPTAQDTKVDNMAVIRVGDKAENLMSVGAMQPAGSSVVPCVINFTVEIVDAGQTDVKGS